MSEKFATVAKNPDELNRIHGASPAVPESADGQTDDDLIGTVYVGRYELNEVIGSGGMGVIYQGRQIFLDRPVAIKMLKSNLTSAKIRMRFQQEAKAASVLNHPGIVSVIDFGVDELDRPYMVMEHVEGCVLSDLLEERVTLPIEDLLPVFFEMSDALAVAHKSGIVHRDLKPSNIMLVMGDDGEVHIKLLDFGVAKMLDAPDRTRQNFTKSGDKLGTPLFMSPEQVEGKEVTHSSDLYSLGCTLYACLTGVPPFIGDSKIETMEMHCTHKPPSLKEASEGLDFLPGIEPIVMRLLEKRPEDRYPTVMQFKAALMGMAMRNGLIDEASGPVGVEGPPFRDGAVSRISKPIADRVHASQSMWRHDASLRASVMAEGVVREPQVGARELADSQDNDLFWKAELPAKRPGGSAGKFGNGLHRRGDRSDGTNPIGWHSGRSRLAIAIVVGAIIAAVAISVVATTYTHLWPLKTAKRSQVTVSVPKSQPAAAVPKSRAAVAMPESQPTNLHAQKSDPKLAAEMEALYIAKPVVAAEFSLTDGAADSEIAKHLAKGAWDKELRLSGLDGLSLVGINALTKFRLLRSLSLSGTNLKDEGLKLLRSMKLSNLDVSDNLGISDLSLKNLADMPTLTSVSLARTGITNNGLKFLADQNMIESLIFDGNREINGSGLENLQSASSRLQSISLADCHVTDYDAAEFLKFKSLDRLCLNRNPGVSDRTIEVLSREPKRFRWLLLAGDHISDIGIHNLTRFKNVIYLDVSGNKLSRKAVLDLTSMKQLKKLWIFDCDLTPSSIESLKKALPKCEMFTNTESSVTL